jgi:hypothetical protein
MGHKFYIVEYAGGSSGCPIYLAGEENCDWEWETYDPEPDKYVIKNKHIFQCTDLDDVDLDFDYIGSPRRFVSHKFIEMCDLLGVKYRAVPVEVRLANGGKPSKDYFFYLAAEWAALLDEEKSEFSLEKNLTTGEVSVNKFYPGAHCYNWIKKFSVRNGLDRDFFWCSELMEHACSQRFVDESIKKGLKGLNFIPIDEHFMYDPWSELGG